MLSKVIVFVFTFFGIFAVLMSTMPTEFVNVSAVYERKDEQVAARFSAANITAYDSLGADNMTYQYSSLDNHPSAPQFELQSNWYLEVWWSHQSAYPDIKRLEFRHVQDKGWLGRAYHRLQLYQEDGLTRIPYPGGRDDHIRDAGLIDIYDYDSNNSVVVGKCDHLSCKALISFNTSKYANIQYAWEAGELSYDLTFEINWTQTGVGVWTIISGILTFLAPNFGVPGVFGTILNVAVAAPVYALIGYLFYKLVTGLIPLASGGGGD